MKRGVRISIRFSGGPFGSPVAVVEGPGNKTSHAEQLHTQQVQQRLNAVAR